MTTITTSGSREPSATLDLSTLRSGFAGELLTPADGTRYEQARTVFNALYDRRPALMARPTSATGVRATLRFARASGLPLAVRGGGHSVAGYSTIDDGVVIDLSAMRQVSVDPVARRVRVQGGATWGEVDAATENPDLFWGLRGGGGNFGIVTEFEFRLHPVGPTVLAGLMLYPRQQAPEVLRFYRDFMTSAPREVAGGVILMHAPPAPFVPPALQGRPAVIIIAAYFGPIERGTELLAPLRAFGSPAVDLIRPMPYVELQAITDAGNPPGRRNYWRSENLATLPDEAVDALIACAATATSPASVIILGPQGGAVADVGRDATALAARSAPWLYHCYGIWTDNDDDRHIAWVRATERTMRPWSTAGISMNFVSDADERRVRRTFGPTTYRRLVELKDRYDPDNLFRLNQNVAPSRHPTSVANALTGSEKLDKSPVNKTR